MSKKSIFLQFVDELMAAAPTVANSIPAEARDYLNALQSGDTTEKVLLTENGKAILKYLQEHPETEMWKAKDIADGMAVSSRTVAGACRKLVTDQFVEKLGESPTLYALTNKGKTFEI